ncbi:MAG TPA: hypothetical protein VK869_08930 [Rubrobacteraceae bacterium]|nr:hypothetical protein [Rubrobacteraceae bacterium]
MGIRSFREAVKRVLGRVFRRRESTDPALPSRAASEIREFAETHAALFERAERLSAKAERLERAGTPSESARNRAERARQEIEAHLVALRASFTASASEGRRAFDREVERRYPTLRVSDGHL